MVVVVPPPPKSAPGVCERLEDLLVEEFVRQPAVEAIDESVNELAALNRLRQYDPNAIIISIPKDATAAEVDTLIRGAFP